MRFTRMSIIALAGLLLVLAGPAQDAAGYGLCGQDWTYKASPMGENYRINANCSDGAAGTAAEQITAINNGAAAWNNAGACFEFTEGATTTGTSVTFNGINLIYFDNTPPDGGSYIAATYYWISGGSNITEDDLVFNDRDYTWNGPGNPTGSQYDIWNIATHELGHYLCLADLYGGGDSAKTMYGYGSPGQTYARTLHSDDIAGIQAIYGVCDDCTDDVFEDNDSFATATTIGEGTVNNLQICSADYDYFTFPVPEGYTAQVDITFTHAAGNLNLYLNDPGFSLIVSSVSSTDNESVTATDLPAGTYYTVVQGVGTAENSYDLTLTLTPPDTQTMSAMIGCDPPSGTLPYTLGLSPLLCNDDTFTRTLYGRINVTVAGGNTYNYWRTGYTNVAAGQCYDASFAVALPNHHSVRGLNTFTLQGTDITPPPYNQPPYSPSGDMDTDFCTTTGN